MRVTIETGCVIGFGTQYRLKILDGYRSGEYVRNSVSEQPLFDVDQSRLFDWARSIGYEVTPGVERQCSDPGKEYSYGR